jgi:hypothetical protein
MIAEGKASESELRELQIGAMQAVLAVDQGQMKVSEAIKVIDAYDRLIGEDRISMREEYRRTLEEKPWKVCPCDICKWCGVHVMVFRGNNRNRRRGFHNTYVFYRLMQRALFNGATAPLEGPQQDLFHSDELTT